ncbi:MAG: hypothetical protein PHN56_04685, partial [Candidatus Nanoarchaeia archaeon]|nr:hypothetical protein [Candidatus Nanoarchaeia archaeon]
MASTVDIIKSKYENIKDKFNEVNALVDLTGILPKGDFVKEFISSYFIPDNNPIGNINMYFNHRLSDEPKVDYSKAEFLDKILRSYINSKSPEIKEGFDLYYNSCKIDDAALVIEGLEKWHDRISQYENYSNTQLNPLKPESKYINKWIIEELDNIAGNKKLQENLSIVLSTGYIL